MSSSDLTFGVEATDVYREIVDAEGEVVRVERLVPCACGLSDPVGYRSFARGVSAMPRFRGRVGRGRGAAR